MDSIPFLRPTEPVAGHQYRSTRINLPAEPASDGHSASYSRDAAMNQTEDFHRGFRACAGPPSRRRSGWGQGLAGLCGSS